MAKLNYQKTYNSYNIGSEFEIQVSKCQVKIYPLEYDDLELATRGAPLSFSVFEIHHVMDLLESTEGSIVFKSRKEDKAKGWLPSALSWNEKTGELKLFFSGDYYNRWFLREKSLKLGNCCDGVVDTLTKIAGSLEIRAPSKRGDILPKYLGSVDDYDDYMETYCMLEGITRRIKHRLHKIEEKVVKSNKDIQSMVNRLKHAMEQRTELDKKILEIKKQLKELDALDLIEA